VQAALAVANAGFGVPKVEALYGFARRRDGGDGGIRPLPLSALQALAQFAVSPDVPLHHFDAAGRVTVLGYREALALAPLCRTGPG
jgi:hypothetical protein